MPKSTLFDSRIKKYAYYEAEEIYREIGTSKDGLTGEQVEMMQQRYGVNSFITKKKGYDNTSVAAGFCKPIQCDSLCHRYDFVGDGRLSRIQLRQERHYCYYYLFHDPNWWHDPSGSGATGQKCCKAA